MTSLFAALHHASILTMLACTLVTLHQLGQPITIRSARLLRRTDLLNGLAATLVLAAGLVRVFYLEKGPTYYFGNGPFLVKLGFYGLASVLSLVPMLELRRWRVSLGQGQVPDLSERKQKILRVVAWLQLAGLAAMALCARMAAQGRL
ncbi:DUF2214 family protein [Ramlibacter sp.]|uniref:DUF2214 family protein n=1 Tax=Ramlibacter sp. TaxID=1917967 RepID=UPI0035B2A792